MMSAALVTVAVLAGGAPPVLELEAAPKEVTVGDLVTVELELTVPDGTRAVFPRWETAWGPAEIRHVGRLERAPTEAGGQRVRQPVTIAFFRPGEFELPPPDVKLVDGNLETVVRPASPLTISVISVLPPNESALEPRPPSPPRALSWGRGFGWTTAILGLLTLAGIAAVASRSRAAAASMPEPLDLLATLRRSLVELRDEASPQVMMSGLSLSLRRFLGRALEFPAVESTTTEIRRRLRAHDLPHDITGPCEAILQDCDGVKFARRPVTEQTALDHLEAAEDLGLRLVASLAQDEHGEEDGS